MIEITKRDKDFLLKLNETGACNTKMLSEFYPMRYARVRIEKMGIEKIVNRKYGLIMLGIEGKNYLESIGVIPKIVDTLPTPTQKRLAQVLELKYLLSNMKIETSSAYKREQKLNRGMQFIAVATTKDNITYLIYDVPKKITLATKKQILRELRNKNNIINNAIVITRNSDFNQILISTNVYISELLIIPPSAMSINLLNTMGDGNFDRRVISAAYPELIDHKMFSQKQNKYMDGINTYVNFVLNNASAIGMLRSIDLLATQNNTSSNQIYNIVCLEDQLEFVDDTIKNLHLKKLNIKYKSIVPGQTSFY